MATKSAKMSQDGPAYVTKTNEGRNGAAPAGRVARIAAPLELEFEEGKTEEAGRICQRICKGFDEVILHAGSLLSSALRAQSRHRADLDL